MRASWRRTQIIGLVLVGGCEFGIDNWQHIDGPQLLVAEIEVVELGPWGPLRDNPELELNPAEQGPISEILPGDRVRLEAKVVDADASVLAPESLDAIWFFCGLGGCSYRLSKVQQACSSDPSEGWTLDSGCRLGKGGALEFVVPPLGPMMLEWRRAYFYVVLALDDSRDAEECLRIRLELDTTAEGCAYMERWVQVGPEWTMLSEAAQLGFEVEMPVYEIPAPALAQPPNRVPKPAAVNIDGSPVPFEGPAVPVERGRTYSLSIPEGPEQVYLKAKAAGPDAYVFSPASEYVFQQWFVTGPLDLVQGVPFNPDLILTLAADLIVPSDAEPGIARVFAVMADNRGAQGLTWLDVEIR